MKFLSLQKEVFGLDISDMSLKIINLKKRGKFFSLDSFNEIEIEPGIIEKGVIQDEEALAKVIKVLYKSVKGKKIVTRHVAVSLPEERSFLQVIQMPNMEDKELQSAVLFEAENYIPLPISEVYLDYQVIKPIKGNINHLDVLIAATPKKIVNSYVSCLKKAGLIPYILEVESQSIARALVKNEATTAPVILVDFGKTSTIFIIFAGRSIQFTCSIPISSDQLTAAIAQSLDIDLEKAEKQKLKYDIISKDSDGKSKKISRAIEPIMENLVAEIKKYSNFYQDHASHEHLLTNSHIEKILLCGGGSYLKGLPEFLSAKLQISVELGNLWTNISKKRLKNNINEGSLLFITALGLALRGVRKREKN